MALCEVTLSDGSDLVGEEIKFELGWNSTSTTNIKNASRFQIPLLSILKYPENILTSHATGLKSDNSKYGLFEGWISNGRALALGFNPNHSKTEHFCPDFIWFLTKWRPFVWISNGWGSGFQIRFQILTICNPNSFQSFKIQTSLHFRSPLYCFQLLENNN